MVCEIYIIGPQGQNLDENWFVKMFSTDLLMDEEWEQIADLPLDRQ